MLLPKGGYIVKKLLIRSSAAKEIREVLMSKAGFDESKIKRDEGGASQRWAGKARQMRKSPRQ